jgi:hypothetical protein
MTDFIQPENIESLGGNSGFQFAPVQDISFIPVAIDGVVTSAVTFNGSATLSEGYASPGSLSWSEAMEETRAGNIFNINVKGFYPRASAAMLALFSGMTRQKFILIITDILGEKMIFGNKNEPLSFNYSKSSKSAPGERAGYDYQFSGIVTEPSPYYLPGD